MAAKDVDKNYVSLHRHDQFSMWDGLDLADRAAARAKELEMPAMALTNHGNTFGLIDHYKACTESGVKPILGMEAYITVGAEKPHSRKLCHQTLLVEDAEGYRNLMKLVTKSQDLFYYKPRISLKMLAEHQKGLLILSGCPSSLIGRRIQNGKIEDAKTIFRWMAREFEGRFWGEIQPSENFEQIAPLVAKWAKQEGVPLVATSDAHYVEKADRIVHDLMLKLKMGKGEEEPTLGAGYHLLTRDEFAEMLRSRHTFLSALQVNGMLDETLRIAERVDFKFEKPKHLLPHRWSNPQKKLRELGEAGLRAKGLFSKTAYYDRLQRELGVIDQLGFHEYFLVCWHIIDHAHKEGILIGPRGSVCGSLLAYVLGITSVDPLVHGTLFERFLHEERKTLPDIDIDVDSRKRESLLGWIQKEYGPNVVPIITFGRYAAKTMANDLEKLFPTDMDEDTKESLIVVGEQMRKDRVYAPDVEVLDEYFDQFDELRHIRKNVDDFDRIFLKLFNQVRYIGRHPGGLCFTPDTYTNWLATVKPKAAAEYNVTCYSMTDIEYLGLIKFDFLGLGAMGAIQHCIDLVKKRHGETIRLDKIPLDDEQLYREFAAGNTDGVFQFETGGARQLLREIEPEAFHELAAVNALNRPGVIDNLVKYVEGKRRAASGYKEKGFFNSTYGAVVYQEDIMLMLRNLGFSWGESDKFIKWAKSATAGAVGARKAEAMVLVDKFVNALVQQKKWDRKDAREYVKTISGYSFNRAHATGYTLVAYWMMWMRRNYSLEFWTSLLDVEAIDEKRALYEKAAIMDGCVLLPPHVNSSRGYTIEDNAIRVGLKTIKALGDVASAAIVEAQPYDSAADFIDRVRPSMRGQMNGKKYLERRQVNTKIIRALMENGALYFNEERWAQHAEDYNVRRKQERTGHYYFKKAVAQSNA